MQNSKFEHIGDVVVGEEGMVKGWTVVKWRADLPPIAPGTKLYAAAPSEELATDAARKPLNGEQIEAAAAEAGITAFTLSAFWGGVRFAERAHGIDAARAEAKDDHA